MAAHAMRQRYTRESIDRLLDAWVWWVRAGRTWPNRLGYPDSAAGFRDQSRAGTPSGPVVPISFHRDREVERIDKAIQALEFPQRCVVKHLLLGTHTSRTLAVIFDASQATISRAYRTGIRQILDEFNGCDSNTKKGR